MSAGWLMNIQWFFPHPVQSFQNLPHPSVAVQKAGYQLRMLHLSAAVQKAGNQLRMPHPSVAIQKVGDQLIHQLPSRKLAINFVNIPKENFQTQIRNVSSILQSRSVHIIPFRALQRKIPDVAYIHIHVQTDLHLYQKSSEEIQSPQPWDHRREKNSRNKTNIFKVTNKQTNPFLSHQYQLNPKKNWFSKLKKGHRSFDSESQRSTLTETSPIVRSEAAAHLSSLSHYRTHS